MARAAPASAHSEAATRFEALYRACYEDLLRYALRRSERPETAADVVADTFLVAWQRIDDIPMAHARPWLFGVARNVIANHHRSSRRNVDLAARLRRELGQVTVVETEFPGHLTTAFQALPEADQELLRLVAWEGLTADDLALALGCSVNAARIRLHRARKKFAEALREPTIPTRIRSSS